MKLEEAHVLSKACMGLRTLQHETLLNEGLEEGDPQVGGGLGSAHGGCLAARV